MDPRARSAATLAGLAAVLAVAAVWAWSAATQPLPGKVDSPLCVERTVDAGTRIFPEDVTVSVFNAGTRTGLAGRVLQDLHTVGFAEGVDGNADRKTDVARVQIWTRQPHSPAVRLVASHLGRHVHVVRRDGPGAGVSVIVGNGFAGLVKGARSVVARTSTVICSPPVA